MLSQFRLKNHNKGSIEIENSTFDLQKLRCVQYLCHCRSYGEHINQHKFHEYGKLSVQQQH